VLGPNPVSVPSKSKYIALNGVWYLILLVTEAGSKERPSNLTVLAPESVAASWKQCEHEPRQAASLKSKLKNLTFLTIKFSVLGVIIPWGDALSVVASAFAERPIIKAPFIYAVPSTVWSVSEYSIPANRLSAVLKLTHLTSPTVSKIAPFLPFLYPV